MSACEVAIPAQETGEPSAQVKTAPEARAEQPVGFGIGSPFRAHATTGVNVFANLPVNKFCLPRQRESDQIPVWSGGQFIFNSGTVLTSFEANAAFVGFIKVFYHMDGAAFSAHREEVKAMVRDYLSMQNMIEDVDYEIDDSQINLKWGGKGIRLVIINPAISFHGECRDTYTLE